MIQKISYIYFNNIYNSVTFNTDYLKQILQMQASTNLMLREIKERINNIQDTMRTHALPSTNINYTLIAQFLPLDTINNIKEFESLMKNTEEAVVQFVSLYFLINVYYIYL